MTVAALEVADLQKTYANGVKALASVPPREVLLAQVAGLLMSPLQRLAGVLAAVAEKKGGGAEAPAAAA